VVSHGLFLFLYSRRLGLVMLYAFGTSWVTILFESFFVALLVLSRGCSSTYYHSFQIGQFGADVLQELCIYFW